MSLLPSQIAPIFFSISLIALSATNAFAHGGEVHSNQSQEKTVKGEMEMPGQSMPGSQNSPQSPPDNATLTPLNSTSQVIAATQITSPPISLVPQAGELMAGGLLLSPMGLFALRQRL